MILWGVLRAVLLASLFAMTFALTGLSAQAQAPVGARLNGEAFGSLSIRTSDSKDARVVRIGWRTQTQTTAQIERSNARLKKTQPNRPGSKVRRSARDSDRPGTATKIKKGNYHYRPAAAPEEANWSYSEVQIARARCQHLLSSIDAEVETVAPIKNGPCGTPAPVRLRSLGSRPKVTLDPPALLNCDMVASLHDWLVKDLQPAARRILRSPITKIETMSSYSCRNAYGRKDTRLSQHGLANAMDIRGFVTANNSETQLVAHWGPTARDIRATKLAAKRKREKSRAKAKAVAAAGSTLKKSRQSIATNVTSPPEAPDRHAHADEQIASTAGERASTAGIISAPIRPSLLDGVSALVARGLSGAIPRFPDKPALAAAPNKLGGPALAQADIAAGAKKDNGKAVPSWPVVLASTRANIGKAQTPRARFLREAHRTGCQRFGTILGPEANYTHRNHFHVDLARRKLGSYCK